MTSLRKRTLWSGTVGLFSPLEARIGAAEHHGYHQLSLGPADVERAAGEGVSPTELGRRVRGAGLEVVLDPVMNWYNDVSASSTSAFERYSAGTALKYAEELDAVALSAMGHIGPPESTTAARLVEPFAELCRQAAEFGALVQLEFIPMTQVASLADAWHVVAEAGAANGGLVFDTWHFYRGTPDFELLTTIPGGRIFAVQVSDAMAEVDGTLLADTRHRRLPGEGTFDLVRVIRALASIDALTCVGPEVISPSLEDMGADTAARIAGRAVDELLARALQTPSGPSDAEKRETR